MRGRGVSWSKGGMEVSVLHSVAAVATQILIRCGQNSILIDAGDGTLRDLLLAGLPPERLGGILLTHGHYDHVGGLHSLLGYMRMKKRKELLPVLLPEGCREAETLVRNSCELCSRTMPFSVDIRKLADGDELAVGPFHISAVGVTHCGVEPDGTSIRMPALGYRLSQGSVTVVVTGDCGDTPPLRDLVRDADLALIEASFASYASKPQVRVHLTEELATEIGLLAREHILIHRPFEGPSVSHGG